MDNNHNSSEQHVIETRLFGEIPPTENNNMDDSFIKNAHELKNIKNGLVENESSGVSSALSSILNSSEDELHTVITDSAMNVKNNFAKKQQQSEELAVIDVEVIGDDGEL
jgi:hypothetical protein